MRCAACGLRSARGFGWFDPRVLTSEPLPACSMRCMDVLCRRWGMVDPDEHEIAATAERHRSPIVLQCVDDYLAGKRTELNFDSPACAVFSKFTAAATTLGCMNHSPQEPKLTRP